MVMLAHTRTGLSFAEGLESCVDLPHTITSAIAYRAQMESIQEIPKDKRPPRGIWEKQFKLDEFIDKMYGSGNNSNKGTTSVTINPEEVEG